MNNSATQQLVRGKNSSIATMIPDEPGIQWDDLRSKRQTEAPQTLRVLVVDDDTSLRQIVATILDESGVIVEMAENGRKALQMLKARQFDLLISDVRMPEMDGFQLLQWVREQQVSIRVIMMSGDDDRGMLLRLMRAGSHDFLHKPFSLDELTEAVERNRQSGIKQHPGYQLVLNLIKQSMHDVHGGLTCVEGVTQLLLKKHHDTLDESAKELLLSVIAQTRTLIDHAKDYAAQTMAIAQSGHYEDDLLDLQSDVIEPVLATLAFESDSKNIVISNLTRMGQRQPRVKGNMVMMKSVARNLFQNSIKYSPKQGRIAYAIVSNGPFYQLVVENETDPFSVAHGGKQSENVEQDDWMNNVQRNAGLGLGLNMAGFFAGRCGGKVRNESTTDGARFIFSVPMPADSRKPERRSYRIPAGERLNTGYGCS